ncbi:hypothetical protein JOL79_20260 [Microbispora sp. RL4-1S]|uniref:DUF2690 domain-containing protein n=1 Tax=Microbispora oryzae TaxID=2806554 RepID=A0A940WML9_9ACTN|nr:hypothetical protein [Microbispora oryzae]MBP2706147.1 hypothetical protein [Microbispora oryzae]
MQRFACELRALRAAAGDPPFWKMARRCEVSKSALAAAVAGRRLPSENVVRNYVLTCGGDWPQWRERWARAVAEAAAGPAGGHVEGRYEGALVPVTIMVPVRNGHADLVANGADGLTHITAGFALIPAVGTGAAGRRVWPWATAAALLAVAVFAVAVFAAARQVLPGRLGPAAAGDTTATPVSAASAVRVLDGTDPTIAGCRGDKVVLDSAPVVLQRTARLRGRSLPAGTTVGTIYLLYSARCAGAWPWFMPTPGLNPVATDTTVGVLTVEGVRPADDTANSWRMGHIDSAYGNLLLTGVGCVRAGARLDMVGQNAEATGKTKCLPQL